MKSYSALYMKKVNEISQARNQKEETDKVVLLLTIQHFSGMTKNSKKYEDGRDHDQLCLQQRSYRKPLCFI